jgi:hypothetical protein
VTLGALTLGLSTGTIDVSSAFQASGRGADVAHQDVVPALPRPPSRVADAVRRSAETYGIDPYLLLGLSYLESGWQMNAVSPVGAIGAMQLMPETALWVIDDLELGRPNWQRSLPDNIRVGAAYLDYLLELSDGDVRVALAAYYQGWRGIHTDGLLSETERYVNDVLALVERFRVQRPATFGRERALIRDGLSAKP